MSDKDDRVTRRKSKPNRPKLSQVARLSGVSVATASRALRGEDRISDETIARVRAVAEMLGYRARNMQPLLPSGQHARLVAAIAPPASQSAGPDSMDQTHTFWFRLFYGFVSNLTARGYGVLWLTMDSQQVMVPLPVSGIVMTSMAVPRPAVVDLGYDVPIMVPGVPDPSDDPRIRAYAGHDNAGMSRDVCSHFASRGARKIALAVRPILGQPPAEWINGYQSWCEQHGQEPVLIIDECDPGQLTKQIQFVIDDGVDAIFVALPALEVALRAIADSGKRVPHEVMVVTWEEAVVTSDEMPEYTRIAPKAIDAAQVLADAVTSMIEGDEVRQIFFEYELVQGRSTLRDQQQ